MLCGHFTKYDSIPTKALCRIDTTGNLDTTFKLTQIFDDVGVYYVQNDGKIIIYGFYMNNYTLIRLNADGSSDSSFNNLNLTYNFWVGCFCPTTDGGYLIGGQFSQYQGYTRHNIAKIDINGFIDTTYFNGQGIDSVYYIGTPTVSSIRKGINDNYYVMGHFTYYNGVYVNPIIRLHGLSVGINEVKKEKIQVFPNPANNQIIFNTGTFKDFNLKIFNSLGQSVFEKHFTSASNTINIQNYKQGIYYYNLVNEQGKSINGKFVKE